MNFRHIFVVKWVLLPWKWLFTVSTNKSLVFLSYFRMLWHAVSLSLSLSLVQVVFISVCQTVLSLPASSIWFVTETHTHTRTVSVHTTCRPVVPRVVCVDGTQSWIQAHRHKGLNQVKSFQLTGTQEVRRIHTLIRLLHATLSHTPYTLGFFHPQTHALFLHAADRTCAKASAFLFVYWPIT